MPRKGAGDDDDFGKGAKAKAQKAAAAAEKDAAAAAKRAVSSDGMGRDDGGGCGGTSWGRSNEAAAGDLLAAARGACTAGISPPLVGVMARRPSPTHLTVAFCPPAPTHPPRAQAEEDRAWEDGANKRALGKKAEEAARKEEAERRKREAAELLAQEEAAAAAQKLRGAEKVAARRAADGAKKTEERDRLAAPSLEARGIDAAIAVLAVATGEVSLGGDGGAGGAGGDGASSHAADVEAAAKLTRQLATGIKEDDAHPEKRMKAAVRVTPRGGRRVVGGEGGEGCWWWWWWRDTGANGWAFHRGGVAGSCAPGRGRSVSAHRRRPRGSSVTRLLAYTPPHPAPRSHHRSSSASRSACCPSLRPSTPPCGAAS